MITAIKKGDKVKVGFASVRALAYDQNSYCFNLTGHATDFDIKPSSPVYKRYRFDWPATATPFELGFREEFTQPQDSLRGVEWSRTAGGYIHKIEMRPNYIVSFKIVTDPEFSTTGVYRLIPMTDGPEFIVRTKSGQAYSWATSDKLIREIGVLKRVAESDFNCGYSWRTYLWDKTSLFEGAEFCGIVDRLFMRKVNGKLKYINQNYIKSGNRLQFNRKAEAVVITENGIPVTLPAKHLIKIE